MTRTNQVKKIRVLRIIARMNVGGPAWQVSALTRGLDKNHFETRLLSGRVDDHEGNFVELRDPELPVEFIGNLGRGPRLVADFRSFLQIKREIRRFRPHIVHTHTAKAGVLGRIAARFEKVPTTIHTFHGHLLRGYFRAPLAWMIGLVERRLARRTSALVAVGTQVRDELLARGVGRFGQFTVIPPGVDSPSPISRAEARERLDLPPELPVALFVGRLTRVKRPDRLLNTFQLVQEQIPNSVLLIAGSGELQDETQDAAQALGVSIQFLGWHPDPGLLYAAADTVLITSDNEGMPVTLIEAAMAGLPCVTTDVGSAREVVANGETGYVVQADAQAIAEKVVTLLSNPNQRERMGIAARERANLLFGTRRLISDHEDLYTRLTDLHLG